MKLMINAIIIFIIFIFSVITVLYLFMLIVYTAYKFAPHLVEDILMFYDSEEQFIDAYVWWEKTWLAITARVIILILLLW